MVILTSDPLEEDDEFVTPREHYRSSGRKDAGQHGRQSGWLVLKHAGSHGFKWETFTNRGTLYCSTHYFSVSQNVKYQYTMLNNEVH